MCGVDYVGRIGEVGLGKVLFKGAFIYDVRCFSGIFDLPTYVTI